MKKLVNSSMPPCLMSSRFFYYYSRSEYFDIRKIYFLIIEFWVVWLLCCDQFHTRMKTQSAVSSATLLAQAADAALPKQKKNMVLTEFKHAKIAHKKQSKTRQEEKGCFHLSHVYSPTLLHRKWLFITFSVFQNLPSYHKMFSCISSVT